MAVCALDLGSNPALGSGSGLLLVETKNFQRMIMFFWNDVMYSVKFVKSFTLNRLLDIFMNVPSNTCVLLEIQVVIKCLQYHRTTYVIVTQ
jgi:hypothetical protein